MKSSPFAKKSVFCFSSQTLRCQVTCARRMGLWSPQQQQEQEQAWRLYMWFRPDPCGPLALPWRLACDASSLPTSASRSAVSLSSGTNSCFMTAWWAWGSGEPGPLTVITLVGRWRGNWVKSSGGVLWSPQSQTPCFWSGREGNRGGI